MPSLPLSVRGNTLGDILADGMPIVASCRVCGWRKTIDVAEWIERRGADYSPFNRRAFCPDPSCYRGYVTFSVRLGMRKNALYDDEHIERWRDEANARWMPEERVPEDIDVCNLYNVTTNVQAIIDLVATFNRPNLPAFGDIYPKYEAPIIRPTVEGNELLAMPWGVPCVVQSKKRHVTNVRNTASNFWRSMLATPGRRCLVPATRFSEWTAEPDPVTGKKRLYWFDVKDADLFCFAGIWRPTEEGERFAFLTSEPNELVGPIHPKAMPVILRPEDYATWLSTDFEGACKLQRPYPAAEMRIVEP